MQITVYWFRFAHLSAVQQFSGAQTVCQRVKHQMLRAERKLINLLLDYNLLWVYECLTLITSIEASHCTWFWIHSSLSEFSFSLTPSFTWTETKASGRRFAQKKKQQHIKEMRLKKTEEPADRVPLLSPEPLSGGCGQDGPLLCTPGSAHTPRIIFNRQQRTDGRQSDCIRSVTGRPTFLMCSG